MTLVIHYLFVVLWSICYCVAVDHPPLKLLAQVAAWLHVLLAFVSFVTG